MKVCIPDAAEFALEAIGNDDSPVVLGALSASFVLARDLIVEGKIPSAVKAKPG